MTFQETVIGRWPRSRRWFAVFLAAIGVSVPVIVLNVLLSELDPAGAWGQSYGILATILLLGAMAYSFRRRSTRSALGKSRDWLQFHVYGGTLFLLLLFMHTGFAVPGGRLAWSMLVLSLWLVMSGLLGVVLQRWIPRLLSSGLSTEVLYERIPELVEVIRDRAETLARVADESVQHFYDDYVHKALEAPKQRWIFFIDVTGGIQSRLKPFEYLRKTLAGKELDDLNELESLYRTKLELDAHYSLQKALRWWLVGHVPVSIVLVALVGFHIYSILKY